MSKMAKHTDVYFLYKGPNRKEPHIQIVVSPPKITSTVKKEATSKIKKAPPAKKSAEENIVRVEVYNRTKEDLSLVKFDVVLLNRSALEITLQDIQGSDLKPNYSGEKSFDLNKQGSLKNDFGTIFSAQLNGLQIVDEKGAKREFKVYIDLVKE